MVDLLSPIEGAHCAAGAPPAAGQPASRARSLDKRVVVLVSSQGAIVTHFATDRDHFPPVATHDRDRVCTLAFQGELTGLPGLEWPSCIAVQGAIYREADIWRISGRTIDVPKPAKRRRKTAQILPFPPVGGRQ
ncbi:MULTISPECIES: hypothetical protein [unclassified Novosphingobium]|uniref:hypothetical protein n=1 Tax=unclassified Novosphingobium TaxID=2644732 RepID=UPI000D311294|nr:MULTISPECIES: hypothetical protein [unclassified Novosphingobium]